MTVAAYGTDGRLEDVQLFAAVVAHGSFTAAAGALGLPKSTLSRRIARLEADLGARLLQRTTRRLSLTEAGADYHARVAPALQVLREAEGGVRQAVTAVQGTLRLTAPVDFGGTVLGPLLAEFLAAWPQVSVEASLTNRAVDLVGEGYDLAIRAGPLRDSTLVARRLGRARRHVCASPAYLGRRGRPALPEALAEHDCLIHSDSPSPGRWHLTGPEGPVVVAVPSRLAVNAFPVLREAALAGQGIALLPAFVVADDLAAGRLEALLEDWGGAEGDLWAVHPGGRRAPGKVRAFLEHLERRLG